MAQAERSSLYNALKRAGYPFTKHFRHYTLEELQDLYNGNRHIIEGKPSVPVAAKDPLEMPSQRRGSEDTPIRTDELGRVWYQEEIIKPTAAAPRGYRKIKSIGSDVKEVTIQAEDGFVETFEVAGDKQSEFEAKVGVPTWQVGIYKDPRLPFRTMVYRSHEAFHREDVETYYGGVELMPDSIKTTYVGNRLCYDIRSVTTAIQREYNLLQTKGAVTP